jgi:hypothetical protein
LLAGVSGLERLAGLDVGILSEPGVRALASCPRWTGLRSLRVVAPNAPEAGLVLLLRWLEGLPLRSLRLHALGALHEATVRALTDSGRWGRLRELSLTGGMTSAGAIAGLAGWPGLGRLDRLQLNPLHGVSGYHLRALAESAHLSPLTRMDLRGLALAQVLRDAFRERLGKRYVE